MIRDIFCNEIKDIMSDDSWVIYQDNYNYRENLKYETIFGLANGYMGTRGAFEEGARNSLPCTFVNGVFDKSETFMRELANLPNWLGIKLYIEKELIGIENCEILEFHRALDMKKSMIVKKVKLRDYNGRETLIEGARYLSRNNVHRTGIRLYLTPLNYSGIVELENIIDASLINFGDAPRFKVKHTVLTKNECIDNNGLYVEVKTRDFNLHIGTGCMMKVYDLKGENRIKNRHFNAFGEVGIEFNDFDAKEGETLVIEKFTTIYTEREVEKENLKLTVANDLNEFKTLGFEEEFEKHTQIYDKMWDMANVEIDGDFELDRAIRFNIFQLMSTGNEHDDHVNLGAKMLHGEEYGGHAFWDTEIFMLPFFAYVFPNTAKNLVGYRYHLLEAARKNARTNGYKGAKYPWESADTGEEECPDWTIEPDGSCYRCYVAKYEHHVTAAVAHGIYNYYKITGDKEFFLEKGAEILLETARFWNSRCEYNEELDRYEINDVTGPDEWHEPVNNNCYTNYLAKWNIELAMEIENMLKNEYPDEYKRIIGKIDFKESEIDNWKNTKDKIYLPQKEGTQLMEQFEGYFDLMNLVVEEYDENDMPKRPLNLREIGVKNTQFIKQADVVMLMYLLKDEFDFESKKVNYDYYEKRSLHGSSLSPSIYSIMGLEVNDESKAYRYLRRGAFIDLKDLQRNTREGMHAANAGGVWKTVVFGFAGMNIGTDGQLKFKPRMPKEWKNLKFKVNYAGNKYEININQNNEVFTKILNKYEEVTLSV